MNPTLVREPVSYKSPERVRLAILVGRSLGCKESTAEQRLWGAIAINEQCARVIRVMRDARADDVLVRWCAPIDAARAYQHPPALTKELRVTEERRDSDEAVAQTSYDQWPTRETAITFVRALDSEIAAKQELRVALAAQWRLV